MHTRLERELPGGPTLLVHLKPGVSLHGTSKDQRITEIWADDTWSDHLQVARRMPMRACDLAVLSEALAELYALKASTVPPRAVASGEANTRPAR